MVKIKLIKKITLQKKGFTLIEVIISVGILSFGLILITQGFIQSLAALDAAQYNLKASLLADKITNQFLSERQDEDKLKEAFKGRVEYGNLEYNLETKAKPSQEQEELKEVISTVSWEAGRRRGEVTIFTYLAFLNSQEDEAE